MSEFPAPIVGRGPVGEAARRPSLVAQFLGAGAWFALFAILALTNPWALAFVVGVLLSVLLHEVGHFWTALRSGLRVTQFFIGFGPRIWSTHRRGVEFGVRALPLGAFVKIIGMNRLDEVAPEDEGATYRQATFRRRILVITAGSLMHLLIAVVAIVSVYAVSGRVEESGRVTIHGVVPGTPADEVGVSVGDVVTAVDGTAVADADTFRRLLGGTPPGTTVRVELLRDGEPIVLTATLAQAPHESAVHGFLGVSSGSIERVPQSIGAACVEGPGDLLIGLGQATVGIVKVMNPVNVLGHLLGTNDDVLTRPTTLVGVARVSDDYGTAEGWAGLFSLLAALNVSVGVFNMFPLLPLDGGHAAIAIYERLRERGGRRYFADVSRLLPIVSVTVGLLAFMFLTGLYLDIVAG